MTIKTEDPLFPPRPEFIKSFDFRDVIRGQSYLIFYAGRSNNVEEGAKLFAYETGDDTNNDGGNTTMFAQTFTTGSSEVWVDSVELLCQNLGAGSDRLYLVGVDGSGNPDMDKIIAWDGETNIGAAGWHKFTFNGTSSDDNREWIKLDANTTYAIVFYNPTAGTIRWRSDDSSPTYTGGKYFISTDTGATWTGDATKDFLFRVNGITVNPYILFPIPFDSDIPYYKIPRYHHPGETDTTRFCRTSIDFDLIVGKTFILKGDAILTFTIQGDNSGESTTSYNVKASINKFDGTTETQLASGEGRVLDDELSDTTAAFRQSIFMNIPNKTRIVKGDVLRLTIDLWFGAEVTVAANILQIYHDPTSRQIFDIDIASADGENSNSGIRTDMLLYLPFVTDMS